MSPEILKAAGLGPKYKIRINDVDVYVSESYKLGDKTGKVIYVKINMGQQPQDLFIPADRGFEELLSDYTTGENGSIDWYGKDIRKPVLHCRLKCRKPLMQ